MKFVFLLLALVPLVLCQAPAVDIPGDSCSDLPTWSQLRAALIFAQEQTNGGFGLEMWGTVVNRDGKVCAVAFTGANRGAQWPGSRAISAQKAYTGNAFSLPGLALSTANLYWSNQPGSSLFGLQFSNPVDTSDAYAGNARSFGLVNDPMVNDRVGGVNVFGGGFGLYNAQHELVGGLGVSGDSSCADHNIGWRTRNRLNLDYVPGGVNSADPLRPDNIIYDLGGNPLSSASGWGHPHCVNPAEESTIAASLPHVRT